MSSPAKRGQGEGPSRATLDNAHYRRGGKSKRRDRGPPVRATATKRERRARYKHGGRAGGPLARRLRLRRGPGIGRPRTPQLGPTPEASQVRLAPAELRPRKSDGPSRRPVGGRGWRGSTAHRSGDRLSARRIDLEIDFSTAHRSGDRLRRRRTVRRAVHPLDAFSRRRFVDARIRVRVRARGGRFAAPRPPRVGPAMGPR